MVDFLIFGILIISIVIAKSQPKAAGVLDIIVASLILLFRVLPGTADVLDWIFMCLFFLGGAVFIFHKKENESSSEDQRAA
jgi:hypothetical protein